jgi:kynurenine formamidase
VRTGRVGRALREGQFPFESFTMASPGLSVRCADWLVRHEVAAVAADNVAVEPTICEATDAMMPLHMICQRDAGIVFGELFDLERLSAACVEEGRWTFLLVAAPIPVTGAVGGPVNPLAIL